MSGFESAVHLFHSGGLVMYPLLILSLITFAIAVERFYYYRINRKGSRTFFHGVYHAAVQKDFDTIGKLCKEFPSAISRIIESGMENASTETSMKAAAQERSRVVSVRHSLQRQRVFALPSLHSASTPTSAISSMLSSRIPSVSAQQLSLRKKKAGRNDEF